MKKSGSSRNPSIINGPCSFPVDPYCDYLTSRSTKSSTRKSECASSTAYRNPLNEELSDPEFLELNNNSRRRIFHIRPDRSPIVQSSLDYVVDYSSQKHFLNKFDSAARLLSSESSSNSSSSTSATSLETNVFPHEFLKSSKAVPCKEILWTSNPYPCSDKRKWRCTGSAVCILAAMLLISIVAILALLVVLLKDSLPLTFMVSRQRNACDRLHVTTSTNKTASPYEARIRHDVEGVSVIHSSV